MDWDEAQRLMKQGRCLHCRRMSSEDEITCEWCLECRFCSAECLMNSNHIGDNVCTTIGIRKGRRKLLEGEIGEIVALMRQRALHLDKEGNIKHREDKVGHTEDVQKPSHTDQKTKKKRRNQRRNKRRDHGSSSAASDVGHSQTSENPVASVSQGKGSFGGPIRCGGKDLSGLDFGGGWWKGAPTTKADPKTKEFDIAKDLWTKLCIDSEKRKQIRSSTIYDQDCDDESDKNDDDNDDETSTTDAAGVSKTDDSARTIRRTNNDKKSDQNEDKTHGSNSSNPSSETTEHSKQEIPESPSKETDSADKRANEGNGGEMVKYDAAKAEEELRKQGKSREKCNFCGKLSYSMKTCSRCQVKKYCDRECQSHDFQNHKEFCKRLGRLKNVWDQLLSLRVSRLEVSLRDGLILECFGMFAEFVGLRPVIAEIVGPYFHPWCPGVVIRDIQGFETFVMFYTDEIVYFHRPVESSMFDTLFTFPIPIPLSECLKPGNHILLLCPLLHFFPDGTQGIRIDDLDKEVRFLFPKRAHR